MAAETVHQQLVGEKGEWRGSSTGLSTHMWASGTYSGSHPYSVPFTWTEGVEEEDAKPPV